MPHSNSEYSFIQIFTSLGKVPINFIKDRFFYIYSLIFLWISFQTKLRFIRIVKIIEPYRSNHLLFYFSNPNLFILWSQTSSTPYLTPMVLSLKLITISRSNLIKDLTNAWSKTGDTPFRLFQSN